MGKADRTKLYITRVAATLFNKKGFPGTSVADIVDAAQVTWGSLYGHFESKDELYLASVDFLLEQWLEGLRSAMAGGRKAGQQLEAFFLWYERKAIDSDEGGSPVINFATEADDLNAEVKRKTGKVIFRLISLICEVINAGIERGELSAQIDSVAFAARVLAAIEGGAALTRITGNLKIIRSVFQALSMELENLRVSETGASGDNE
jgi:TetR/AcrR family transcriptional repressor of nem operon